jgi:hypothetical protein
MTNVDIAARLDSDRPDSDCLNSDNQPPDITPNSPMVINPTAGNSAVNELAANDLAAQFQAANEKNQLQLINAFIAAGEAGHQVLLDHLQQYQAQGCSVSPIGLVPAVAAKAYQKLYQTGLHTHPLKQLFPQGIVPLTSEQGIDYQPLAHLLVQQDWQAADKLHNLKLCEAAGAEALARKWIYFSEVNSLPIADLRTLNALWVAHSEGKFGYSVQRQIWLSVGQNWDKFWPKLSWKTDNLWMRYPGQFVWSLENAPLGHLPLSNQLRGVQVMNALMNHPAWLS